MFTFFPWNSIFSLLKSTTNNNVSILQSIIKYFFPRPVFCAHNTLKNMYSTEYILIIKTYNFLFIEIFDNIYIDRYNRDVSYKDISVSFILRTLTNEDSAGIKLVAYVGMNKFVRIRRVRYVTYAGDWDLLQRP